MHQAALTNLSTALFNVGRRDESLVIEQHLVAICRRVNGPESYITLMAEENLAISMAKQGGVEEKQRALKIMTRTHALMARDQGADDPFTLTSALHLALAHRNVGNLARAVAMLRAMLPTLQRILGDEHTKTLECWLYLAGGLVEQGDIDEARAMCEMFLPIFARVLGPDHPFTTTFKNPDFLDPTSKMHEID